MPLKFANRVFACQDTVLTPLGLNGEDPEFVTEWVAHVVDLLTHGVLAADRTP